MSLTAHQPPVCRIQAVTTPQENELFLHVPWRIYANDPHWVPPLYSEVAKQFAPSNPFLQYGKFQQFIALPQEAPKSKIQNPKSKIPLGRIVAAVNPRLIEREQYQIGLFGFFECVEDFTVAQALLNAACQWLRDQGMTHVRGPINFSTHNGCFFQVDGFGSPPTLMMPYNPPYYSTLMEQDGWSQAKDAYAYDLPLDQPLPPRYEKGYRIACKTGITFRPIRNKGEGFHQDCLSLYNFFTRAFTNNWSSTPRTQEEFMDEARSLKDLVNPDIFPIAEDKGEMVGFFMALPDYNIALKHVNGKLNWLGILKFLWYRRKINQGRVIAIAALPEYRRKMLPLALIYKGWEGNRRIGTPYKRADLSWVFEDNMPSRKIIEATGATRSQTYRIYEKELG